MDFHSGGVDRVVESCCNTWKSWICSNFDASLVFVMTCRDLTDDLAETYDVLVSRRDFVGANVPDGIVKGCPLTQIKR